MKKILALIFGMSVLLASQNVFADVPLPTGHVTLSSGDGELIAPNGQRYYLPMGTHILDGTSWQKLDTEVKRLQDEVTRKDAENKSLRNALSSWTPGWGTLVVLTGLALAVGGTAYYLNN